MVEVSAKFSFPPELIDVFAEDSENDRTFNGFDDSQLSDLCEKDEDEAKLQRSPEEQSSTSRRPGRAQPFRLRVALRSASAAQRPSMEVDAGEEEERPQNRRARKPGKLGHAKKEKRVKFDDDEEGEAAAARPPPPKEHGSDEDAADSFLAKREQNIKANKAMLAQLMADLQMMPGGAGLLKKQAAKQPKERNSRPPRSGGESRRNPERASRRTTRSMGLGESEEPKEDEEELEFSLEEELLEVRRAPRQRSAPRPSKSKPHLIRPVEDITEDEIELVADNMTEKVYNSATGSTCHQCRQKTIDTKTCCRSEDCRGIQGQFCGPCLRNRYGEDVRKALRDPEWRCPPCRGICNCSFCRQRDGRCPTGILFPLAQYHGFSDVHSYLTSLRSKLKSEDDVEM